MAYVVPNSIIEVFSGVKLNKDSEDTIYFGTRADQNTYFSDPTKVTMIYRATDYQFIRAERESMRVKCGYAQVENANYIRFTNTAFGNKYFYAFVTGVNYISNECTEIEFEIDPLQTWLPNVDYQLNDCRIIRQHQTGSDNIGDNTQPESIQIPVYHPTQQGTRGYEDKIDLFENGYYIAIMLPRTHQGSDLFYGYNNGTYATPDYKPLNGEGDIPFLQMIDNVPCENVIVLIDMTDNNVPEIGDPEYDPDFPNTKRSWLRFIKINRYWGEFIVNTWVIPKDVIPASVISDKVCLSTGSQYGSATYVVCPNVIFNYSITYTVGDNYINEYLGDVHANDIKRAFVGVTHNTLHGDYTVVNKKVFTNPICYYEIISPNGQIQNLSFEDMRADLQDPISGIPEFPNSKNVPYVKLICGILDPKISIVPFGYNYLKYSFEKQSGIPTPPVGASKGVIDTSIPNNAISSIVEMGLSAVGTMAGGALGTAVGKIGGAGAMAITQNTMPQGSSNIYNLSNITLWAENIRYFTGVYMCAENYQELDAFFSAYGYTQNKFATPDITHRTQWTYVQTNGANFKPISITANAMKQINDKFDSGVRFHRDDSTIGSMFTFDQTLQKYVLKTNAIIP